MAGGDQWRVRRRAVAPSLHREYLEVMLERVFGASTLHLVSKLESVADTGGWGGWVSGWVGGCGVG